MKTARGALCDANVCVCISSNRFAHSQTFFPRFDQHFQPENVIITEISLFSLDWPHIPTVLLSFLFEIHFRFTTQLEKLLMHFLQHFGDTILISISKTWFTLSFVFEIDKNYLQIWLVTTTIIAVNIKFVRVVAVADRVCLTFKIYYSRRICWNHWSRKMISFNSWRSDCFHSHPFNCTNFHCEYIDFEKKNVEKRFKMCH